MLKKALALAATSLLCLPTLAQSTGTGNIEVALSKLDNYICTTIQMCDSGKQPLVPGLAVGVVYKGRVVYLKGYGVRRMGYPDTVDPDTVFEIASVSKPIATTIVATLVDSGDVTWDDHIRSLDPNFSLSDRNVTDQVTLRDMLSHSSGLPSDAGDVLEDLGYTRPEILSRLRYLPLAGPIGTYHYSNYGITEGAIAASLRTSKTWEELAQSRLFHKLEMNSTSSRFSDYENRPNKASLHYLDLNNNYHNWFVREADAESPAGGVSSSVRDLANFVEMQLNNGVFNGQQVVSKNNLDETHKPEICAAGPGPYAPGKCPGPYYGLGWDISTDAATGHTRISHSGAFLLGTATNITLDPVNQLGIVVITNGTPIGVPESIANDFLDYFNLGKPQRDWLAAFGQAFDNLRKDAQASSPDYSTMKQPSNPSGPGQLSAYVGSYASNYYGTVTISMERGRLIMRLPPRGDYNELSPWDGPTFTYYYGTETSGVARRGVKFLNGGQQLLIQNFAQAGSNGVFQRIH